MIHYLNVLLYIKGVIFSHIFGTNISFRCSFVDAIIFLVEHLRLHTMSMQPCTVVMNYLSFIVILLYFVFYAVL